MPLLMVAMINVIVRPSVTWLLAVSICQLPSNARCWANSSVAAKNSEAAHPWRANFLVAATISALLFENELILDQINLAALCQKLQADVECYTQVFESGCSES
jgi:hypothetical protein